MKSKDLAFWRSHLKEAAMRNLNTSEMGVEAVMDMVISVGNVDPDTALRKLGMKESGRDGRKLVETLNVDEEAEEDGAEEVDEGEIEYHDYKGELIENHPHDAVGVNDYSMLSVQEGHRG